MGPIAEAVAVTVAPPIEESSKSPQDLQPDRRPTEPTRHDELSREDMDVEMDAELDDEPSRQEVVQRIMDADIAAATASVSPPGKKWCVAAFEAPLPPQDGPPRKKRRGAASVAPLSTLSKYGFRPASTGTP